MILSTKELRTRHRSNPIFFFSCRGHPAVALGRVISFLLFFFRTPGTIKVACFGYTVFEAVELFNPFGAPESLPILSSSDFIKKNGFPGKEGVEPKSSECQFLFYTFFLGVT